jgi:predicted ABC-type ATPase
VVVNADEIARSLPSASVIEAGRRAIRERRRCLSSGTSFAIETTLSGRRELDLMRDARTRGFMVVLHYVGVDSAELCRIRVDERVAKGGHDVPDADLRRRFHRSMSTLSSAVVLAETAFVYDNSTRRGIVPVASFRSGQLAACAPELPRWLERALGSVLRR